jgi:hypothetical protein
MKQKNTSQTEEEKKIQEEEEHILEFESKRFSELLKNGDTENALGLLTMLQKHFPEVNFHSAEKKLKRDLLAKELSEESMDKDTLAEKEFESEKELIIMADQEFEELFKKEELSKASVLLSMLQKHFPEVNFSQAYNKLNKADITKSIQETIQQKKVKNTCSLKDQKAIQKELKKLESLLTFNLIEEAFDLLDAVSKKYPEIDTKKYYEELKGKMHGLEMKSDSKTSLGIQKHDDEIMLPDDKKEAENQEEMISEKHQEVLMTLWTKKYTFILFGLLVILPLFFLFQIVQKPNIQEENIQKNTVDVFPDAQSPKTIKMLTPQEVYTNEPFSVKILIYDKNFRTVKNFIGSIDLKVNGTENQSVIFEKYHEGVFLLSSLNFDKEGKYEIQATSKEYPLLKGKKIFEIEARTKTQSANEKYTNLDKKTQDTLYKKNLTKLRNSIELFYTRKGYYPRKTEMASLVESTEFYKIGSYNYITFPDKNTGSNTGYLISTMLSNIEEMRNDNGILKNYFEYGNYPVDTKLNINSLPAHRIFSFHFQKKRIRK